jgi:hypothetical protein
MAISEAMLKGRGKAVYKLKSLWVKIGICDQKNKNVKSYSKLLR